MAEDSPVVDLKILSPSTEAEGGIFLNGLPASTTVADLRHRIQDELSTKPAIERMRLIYRGRVVGRDTDTLADIFGLENLRESREQSLHLVLRELHTASSSTSAPSSAPRSSTTSPNPFRTTQTPPQTNPFRTTPIARPHSQPQVPNASATPHAHPNHHVHTHSHGHGHAHGHAHHHIHRAPQPQNPFGLTATPVNITNVLQQQLAQAQQRFAQEQQQLSQQLHAQYLARANNQNPNVQSQQPDESTPTPTDGAQAAQAVASPGTGSGAANPTPDATRAIRHQAIGPNGQRWTMTFSNNVHTLPAQPNQQPILPRPFPHPPGFTLPTRPASGSHGDPIDQVLSRVRISLQAAHQEMENIRVLLRSHSGESADSTVPTPPVWRIDRIRQHMQNLTHNLDQVQRGLASLVADHAMANNQDVVLLQQSANELRGHAEELNEMLDRVRENGAAEQAAQDSGLPSSTSNPQSTSQQSLPRQTPDRASPAVVSPELFILSSPQGPVGVLFDHRGTYSTAPMVPTLPFQSFTQQFAVNRQLLAGISQQAVQASSQVHDHLANRAAQNTPVVAGANQPAAQDPAQNQNPDQVQNQAQNQNQNLNQIQNPPPENDRLAVAAGHLWLLFKLACFIYIFSGGGGWYRPVMLGIAAVLLYLAQVGLFEDQFDRVRRHFEALLPLADRHARNQNGAAQGAANGLAPGQGQGQAQDAQRAEPNRNLTPEQAAQRLVNQHHEQRFGWVRETMRTTERAFALFVASLWPGIGERMVQAQEDRVRAVMAAEEERLRQQEEERQRVEAEQSNQNTDAGAGDEESNTEHQSEAKDENGVATESKGKGKERADTEKGTEDEPGIEEVSVTS